MRGGLDEETDNGNGKSGGSDGYRGIQLVRCYWQDTEVLRCAQNDEPKE